MIEQHLGDFPFSFESIYFLLSKGSFDSRVLIEKWHNWVKYTSVFTYLTHRHTYMKWGNGWMAWIHDAREKREREKAIQMERRWSIKKQNNQCQEILSVEFYWVFIQSRHSIEIVCVYAVLCCIVMLYNIKYSSHITCSIVFGCGWFPWAKWNFIH